MKDKICLLLDIIGALLVFLGIAYIFLEIRRLGPGGGPTMLLGLILVCAGLAIGVVASRRRKKLNPH